MFGFFLARRETAEDLCNLLGHFSRLGESLKLLVNVRCASLFPGPDSADHHKLFPFVDSADYAVGREFVLPVKLNQLVPPPGPFSETSMRRQGSAHPRGSGIAVPNLPSLLHFLAPVRGSAIGSTPAFGAGYPGSSPGPGAILFALAEIMNTPDLALGAIWYIVFLFSTTCHEAAHALVAKLGGDLTAAEGGQVTLNPIPHIRRSPYGMVVIPILSFALGGWMVGWASAPFDPNWERSHPHRAARMALGGPAANFTIMLVAALAIRIGLMLGYFAVPLSITGYSTLVQPASGNDPTFVT